MCIYPVTDQQTEPSKVKAVVDHGKLWSIEPVYPGGGTVASSDDQRVNGATPTESVRLRPA